MSPAAQAADFLELADHELLTNPNDHDAEEVIAALWRDAVLVYDGRER